MADLRVLLYGPRPGRDALSGDLAYVQALLDAPPPGVRYVPYDEAIGAGDLEVLRRPRRPADARLGDVGWFALKLAEKPLRHRRARLLFREAHEVVRLRPGAFDLVHQHVFALRQVGAPRVPAVSSAGYPLPVLYENTEAWRPARARRAERVDLATARRLGVHRPGLWAPRGDVLTVYTHRFADHVALVSGQRAHVVGQALPDDPLPRSPLGRPLRTIGFVAYRGMAKGLDLALQAVQRLQGRQPNVRFHVVCAHLVPGVAENPGVRIEAGASHDDVVRRVLPALDVLVLPTRSDCGAPSTVMEALRAGVPVVSSAFEWLDERLVEPAVARPPVDDTAAVTAALLRLTEPGALDAAKLAARQLYEAAFRPATQHAALHDAYALALRGSGRRTS